nr:MFS transporter [Rhizobium rhizogenes]
MAELVPDSLQKVYKYTTIRYPTLALFCTGVSFAVTLPYQSIFLIEVLGFSPQSYSMMMTVISLVTVSASLSVGIFSDRLKSRRPIILAAAVLGFLGYGIVHLTTNTMAVTAALCVVIPLSSIAFPQLFGVLRANVAIVDPDTSGSIMSTARMIFALSWVIAPPVIGIVVNQTNNIQVVYAIASIISLISFGIFLSPSRVVPAASVVKPLRLTSLAETFTVAAMIRIVLVSVIIASHALNAALMPLIVSRNGVGSIRDVGIIVGAVALIEIPSMIIWGNIVQKRSARFALATGGLIFASYLALLSVASQLWQIYLLIPLNAVGAAAILSISIPFLQDIARDRPGLGSSLISVTNFVGAGISAVIFASGAIVGYSSTAVIGAIICLLAAGTLLRLRHP